MLGVSCHGESRVIADVIISAGEEFLALKQMFFMCLPALNGLERVYMRLLYDPF